jgi:hypothetical protein
MIEILIIGATVAAQSFEADAVALPGQAEKFVRYAGELVIGESKRQFVGSRTRSLYAISGGRRVRRNPPRPVTSPPNKLGVFEGRYRQAITQDVRHTGHFWETEIGPEGIPYARVHELGIGRMPKRPVMQPGLEAALPRIVASADKIGPKP